MKKRLGGGGKSGQTQPGTQREAGIAEKEEAGEGRRDGSEALSRVEHGQGRQCRRWLNRPEPYRNVARTREAKTRKMKLGSEMEEIRIL